METSSVHGAGTNGAAEQAGGGQAAASSRPAEGQGDHRLTIGDMAREFGLSLRALRFYEDRGLITPCRRGAKRLYSESDRSRLQLILKGKQLGFTLAEIRELLRAHVEARESGDLGLNLNPEQIATQIRHLERQREELEVALSELRAAHQRAQTIGSPLTAA